MSTLIRHHSIDGLTTTVELRDLSTNRVLVAVNIDSVALGQSVEAKGLDEALRSTLRPFVGILGLEV